MSKMDVEELAFLTKALEIEKKKRLEVEKVLKKSSKDFYETINELEKTNEDLEKLLSEKTSELEGVFYNIIDPYIIMDIMGNVMRMNTAAKELLGYDIDKEAINLTELVLPEYIEYTIESFKELYNSGKIKNYKVKILAKDKTEKFILVNSCLIYNKEGQPIAAQGIIRDITNENKVEQLLVEKREQLNIIVDNSPLGILLTVDGSIIKANKRSIELLGYSEKELMKLNLEDISISYAEDGLSETEKINSIDTKENYTLIKKYYKKNGSTFLAKTSVSNVEQETESKGYQVAIIEDITEQKNLEEQKEELVKELEASNKGLQEYAYIVSHDLKSPLQSISALASWLREDYSDKLDENGVFQLKAMQEKVETMDRLIDGILKYSTTKSDSLDNKEVDVNAVIQDIKHIIFIPDHVELKTLKTLPIIFADKTKIHQLFQNIISNAVVHIENEKGLVVVDCKETPTHWEFSIKDNGVGIPKKYHDRIFKIFQSVGDNDSKKSTGIGLSIVKNIIDRYKGKIWLDSEIGKGTTFYFTIKKDLKV